jgi:hypothetical protein
MTKEAAKTVARATLNWSKLRRQTAADTAATTRLRIGYVVAGSESLFHRNLLRPALAGLRRVRSGLRWMRNHY